MAERSSPLRAVLGARFVVVGAVADGEQRLEVLVADEDHGWIEGELEAAGATRTGTLLDGGSSFTLVDGTTLDLVGSDAPWLPAALECAQLAPNGLPVIGLPYLVLYRLASGRSADAQQLERVLGTATEAQLARVRAAVDAFMPDVRGDLESVIALARLAHTTE